MNKTVLITGTSTGLGKETARLFQAKGWNVVATMRSPQQETQLTALDNVLVTRLDVLDPSSIQEAVKVAIQRFGQIDVLVNNAGYGAYGPLESFSRERIRRQFDTNVIGLIEVTQTVLPHFRQNKNGIIINISSVGGRITFPLGALYHGTKFAVEGLSESLSYEVAQFGGAVKIVEPGGIATDFMGRSLDFSHDERMTDYQSIVGKVMVAMGGIFEQASAPNLIAEVVYEAATDGKQQLRYSAGADAKVFLANRQQADDQTFMHQMRVQFAL